MLMVIRISAATEASPPEPSPGDANVSDAFQLNAHICRARAAQDPAERQVSLRIIGVINLGVLASPVFKAPPSPNCSDAGSLLPFIDNVRITLWSDLPDATLDGNTAGQLFVVIHSGKLLMQGLHITGGSSALDSLRTGGSCGRTAHLGARLILRSMRFSNCHTTFSGGGIVVESGVVDVSDSVFADMETSVTAGEARGGDWQ